MCEIWVEVGPSSFTAGQQGGWKLPRGPAFRHCLSVLCSSLGLFLFVFHLLSTWTLGTAQSALCALFQLIHGEILQGFSPFYRGRNEGPARIR